MRSRSSSILSSSLPSRRNLMFAHTSRASWRRLIMPRRYAARPNWNALDPSISVLSRSKKAAGRAMPSAWTRPGRTRLPAVDFDYDGVALTAAGADRRAAEPPAAAAQLVDERHQDAGAAGADRVAERDGTAVHVHLRLVNAEHADRVDRHGRERLVDLEQVDVV